MYRLTRDSTKAGYENAHFAWAVDSLSEEKEHGCTISNSFFSLEKKAKSLNFYDTPCMNDFIYDSKF